MSEGVLAEYQASPAQISCTDGGFVIVYFVHALAYDFIWFIRMT